MGTTKKGRSTVREDYYLNGRYLVVLYRDEYGQQFIYFKITGNKRLKLWAAIRRQNGRLSYIKTNNEELGKEWRKVEMRDQLL